MTIPTTCTNCGFGRDHICERSVCPCLCHEVVVAESEPSLQPEESPQVLTAIQATVADLDAQEEVQRYALAQ